jgi:hypothetical protein
MLKDEVEKKKQLKKPDSTRLTRKNHNKCHMT